MNVLNRIVPLPAQKLLLGISLFFWCGAMHLYWPNNGGSGLSLPLNITSWIYAVVLAASALMLVPRQRWRITVPAAGFMVGAFILALLCLQTPNASGSRSSSSVRRCAGKTASSSASPTTRDR